MEGLLALKPIHIKLPLCIFSLRSSNISLVYTDCSHSIGEWYSKLLQSDGLAWYSFLFQIKGICSALSFTPMQFVVPEFVEITPETTTTSQELSHTEVQITTMRDKG